MTKSRLDVKSGLVEVVTLSPVANTGGYYSFDFGVGVVKPEIKNTTRSHNGSFTTHPSWSEIPDKVREAMEERLVGDFNYECY